MKTLNSAVCLVKVPMTIETKYCNIKSNSGAGLKARRSLRGGSGRVEDLARDKRPLDCVKTFSRAVSLAKRWSVGAWKFVVSIDESNVGWRTIEAHTLLAGDP